MIDLILASGSEWRRRLLERLGLEFGVQVSGVDEERFEVEEPEELVVVLAAAKARAVVDLQEHGVVVAADTVIVSRGEVIGKPQDREEAREIIERLAGGAHAVISGVCVMEVESGEQRVEAVKTRVRFLHMSEEQVEAYLDTDEWKGKAGGYQVQRSISTFIAEVDGSVSNVVGLPLVELEEMLEYFGVRVEMDVKGVERELRDEVFG